VRQLLSCDPHQWNPEQNSNGDNEHDISNALRLRRLYCIRFDDEKKMRHMWLCLHIHMHLSLEAGRVCGVWN